MIEDFGAERMKEEKAKLAEANKKLKVWPMFEFSLAQFGMLFALL